MAFLAALALAGFLAAASLARHWQEGAAAALTVQVPDPTGAAAGGGASRLASVLERLRADPAVAAVHPLSEAELASLLKPWLGADPGRLALPLPAVIAVRLADPEQPLADLGRSLAAAAPGTLVESHGVWAGRIAALARSLEASAAVVVVVVALVAVAVVAVATHAGLAMRREAIEIVHGLGATDGYIAARFAARATRLAAVGGVLGTIAALPALLTLATLAAPFGALGGSGVADEVAGLAIGSLSAALWFALPLLPALAGAIGYLTAQGTVRRWLRRLP